MKTLITLLLLLAQLGTNNLQHTQGKFYGGDTYYNCNTKEYEILYQFKSNDNKVWWLLNENEIGFKPDSTTQYELIFDNNGTTNCDCASDCECYVYDDTFIGIIKGE